MKWTSVLGRWFSPGPRLHPELRHLKHQDSATVTTRSGVGQLRAEAANLSLTRLPDGVSREMIEIPETHGLHLYIYMSTTPTDLETGEVDADDLPEASGALLWMHGGGMMTGSPVADDAFCAHLVHTLGITVVSVDYRLAPENPYPAPLDDAEAAWAWVLDHADLLNIDPHLIAVGGRSSGAGLAAGLTVRLQDRRAVQPNAQWLFSPMLDDRTAANEQLDHLRHVGWDNASNRAAWWAYLSAPPGSADVPAEAAPARRENLRRLPPTWIGTGTAELFHQENLAFAQRLKEAKVQVELDSVDGAPHGFENHAPTARVVQDYLGRATAWLAGQVGVSSSEH